MKKYEDLKLDILLSKLNGLQDYGLTKEEVEERLLKYGKNTIQSSQKKSIFKYLIDSFKDITIIILLVAVILSTYVSLKTHPDNLTEPLVIIGIIILNIVLSIREQIKAEKSMDALKESNVIGIPDSYEKLTPELKKKGALISMAKASGYDPNTLLRLMATMLGLTCL